tara:strand:+ start:14874 stop:15407 length:534 start_codon:yes stop_codon:yes gene_type:complete
MVDNTSDIDDGVGRYASRIRVNRKVITLTPDGTNTMSTTIQLNGKIGRVVLDASRITCNSNAGTTGSLEISMDMQDTAGTPVEYLYCDALANFDVRTAVTAAYHFQTSEGGNMNADAGNTSGLHFTVTAPSATTTGGVTIDEPASWSGLVCGAVKFTLKTSNGVFSAGTARIVVIHE